MSLKEPGAFGFVWSLWGALTLGLMAFAIGHGANVPIWDEWANAKVWAGDEPLTLSWLWSQHNEHRLPLPRIVAFGLWKATGGDYRGALAFNVMALAASSAALMAAASRQRGGTSYADAVFPLTFLHLGQHGNVLFPFQVQFACSTLLASLALAGLAGGASGAALVGAALVLAPLCGANGIALVPGLAVGALWLAWSLRRERQGPAIGLAACALIGVAIVGANYVGYRPVRDHESTAGLMAGLEATSQVMANGWGPGVRELWPGSGIALGAVAATTIMALIWGSCRSGRAAWGLWAFAGALTSLAVGLGLGRAGLGPLIGFEARYVMLMAPFPALAFLAIGLVPNEALRRSGQFALAFLACALAWRTERRGLSLRGATRRSATRFWRTSAGKRPRFG